MKSFLKISLISILSIPLFSADFITIGTGSVTGTYYPTGGAICKLVNQNKKENNIRCSVESTDGSIYNVNNLYNKELDFGIVQSDVLYNATKGKGVFKDTPMPKLKSVMAIYPELLTLVTKKDANINKLLDIKDKKINLGNSGSGNETTTLTLFEEIGFSKSNLEVAATFPSSEMADALKENKIDGYFYMVGHPTATIKDTANWVDIRIIPIENNILDSLIKKYPYFAKSNIKAGTYKGQDSDIPTFGVKAVLVTTDDTSAKVVYALTKAVVDNFEEFKKLHPAYANITKESLFEGLSAPLHEGAKKYFKEIELIK